MGGAESARRKSSSFWQDTRRAARARPASFVSRESHLLCIECHRENSKDSITTINIIHSTAVYWALIIGQSLYQVPGLQWWAKCQCPPPDISYLCEIDIVGGTQIRNPHQGVIPWYFKGPTQEWAMWLIGAYLIILRQMAEFYRRLAFIETFLSEVKFLESRLTYL